MTAAAAVEEAHRRLWADLRGEADALVTRAEMFLAHLDAAGHVTGQDGLTRDAAVLARGYAEMRRALDARIARWTMIE